MFTRIIITFLKTSNTTGTATLQFQDKDENDQIIINQVRIDLNDGASPINILKAGGTPIVQGTMIEKAKKYALELFQEYEDLSQGIYEFEVNL